jgi:hypothetical protein
MPEGNDSNYPIGYGKPPKHTRFKPGKSGNPNGRPRKSTTLEEDIERELAAVVTIHVDEKPRRFTKRQLIAKGCVNKAVKGDTRSTQLLLKKMTQRSSHDENNVGALIQEFRERNRLLEINDFAEEKPFISSVNSSLLKATEGEDS